MTESRSSGLGTLTLPSSLRWTEQSTVSMRHASYNSVMCSVFFPRRRDDAYERLPEYWEIRRLTHLRQF